jgi:hypothetical protein
VISSHSPIYAGSIESRQDIVPEFALHSHVPQVSDHMLFCCPDSNISIHLRPGEGTRVPAPRGNLPPETTLSLAESAGVAVINFSLPSP